MGSVDTPYVLESTLETLIRACLNSQPNVPGGFAQPLKTGSFGATKNPVPSRMSFQTGRVEVSGEQCPNLAPQRKTRRR
jgi:hypothetical protein